MKNSGRFIYKLLFLLRNCVFFFLLFIFLFLISCLNNLILPTAPNIGNNNLGPIICFYMDTKILCANILLYKKSMRYLGTLRDGPVGIIADLLNEILSLLA